MKRLLTRTNNFKIIHNQDAMFQPASFTLKVETIRCKYIATTPEEGRRDDLGRQREALYEQRGQKPRFARPQEQFKN